MLNFPILIVDYETYYDKDYSLSTMQTDAYCLDPRFEIILVSVTSMDGRQRWFSGTLMETQAWLLQFPWDQCAVACHNTLFDGFIHRQVLGLPAPKMWIDTLGMARAIYPYLPSHGLKAVASYLGVGEKGTEVEDFKGRRRESFALGELERYAAYCMNDGTLTRHIFSIMSPQFPDQEFVLVDQRIRMFVDPLLELNTGKLKAYYEDTIAKKQKLLENPHLVLGDVDISKETLMSNPKFAAALEALGVQPPMKTSKTTGRSTYAFAKTDEGMAELAEHPDPAVQALVAARLGNKSTIAETRAQKFVETGERGRGWPVYLNYWGAKTTGRDSGGNKINALNLPNRGEDRVLRESIEAPRGCVVVVGDSANIELRVNFVLSGQDDLIDRVKQYDAQGKSATSDLYCDFATQIFGRPVTKKDEKDRFVGKTGELGLGYACGATTFGNMLRVQGGMKLDEEELKRIIEVYRETHRRVQESWRRMERLFPAMRDKVVGKAVDVHGWFLTDDRGGFSLPGMLGVQYHELAEEHEGWTYQQGKLWPYLYGGKAWENVCVDGNALVLTGRGWVPLKFVHDYDEVHDGVEFVSHGGTILKGNLECVTVDGVHMTPDHEVLTHAGWETASQSPEPYRPVIRTAHCDTTVGERWEEVELAVRMRLRSKGIESWGVCSQGSEAWRYTELRVHNQCADVQGVEPTRDESSSGVPGVEEYGRSLSSSLASCMGELRRTWNSCVQGLGRVVRGVLEGYGVYLHAWADARPTGQFKGLLPGELRVEIAQVAGTEQAREHRSGSEDTIGGERCSTVDAVLPIRTGTAVVEVWDLMDCGPRNRFVVLGKNGPFIVHNCQHAARQIVMWQAARVGLRYPVVLTVYDEIVAVAPEDKADDCKAWVQECLMLAPKWCRGVMPLNGSVGVGRTYGDAK